MTGAERIKQARENRAEALILAAGHIGTKAVLAKLYHAMMNCLFALFDIQDIGRLTHADIIDRFEREWVTTGRIEAGINAVLRRAYDLTHECDCDHMPVPTDEEITSAMKAAENLIRETEGLLRTEVRI